MINTKVSTTDIGILKMTKQDLDLKMMHNVYSFNIVNFRFRVDLSNHNTKSEHCTTINEGSRLLYNIQQYISKTCSLILNNVYLVFKFQNLQH